MCNCLTELDKRLKPQGLKVSDKDLTLVLPNDGTSTYWVQTLPLVQAETGKKPKSTQPKSVAFTYCPFCGEKYNP